MKARKKPRYSTGRPELDAKLEELVSAICPGREKDHVLQIATSALKLGIEKAKCCSYYFNHSSKVYC